MCISQKVPVRLSSEFCVACLASGADIRLAGVQVPCSRLLLDYLAYVVSLKVAYIVSLKGDYGVSLKGDYVVSQKVYYVVSLE